MLLVWNNRYYYALYIPVQYRNEIGWNVFFKYWKRMYGITHVKRAILSSNVLNMKRFFFNVFFFLAVWTVQIQPLLPWPSHMIGLIYQRAFIISHQHILRQYDLNLESFEKVHTTVSFRGLRSKIFTVFERTFYDYQSCIYLIKIQKKMCKIFLTY